VEGLTIERNDVNGNYEPSNCSFIPLVLQNKNKTNNRVVVVNGLSIKVIDAAVRYGIPGVVITNRLNSGMPPEEAVTRPYIPLGPKKKTV
jgi:hypothetical protein